MVFRTFNSGGGASVTFAAPSGDVAIGDPTGTGTSTSVPHADHVHAFPAATAGAGASASAPGDTENDGAAGTASRSDHVHGREAWAAAVSSSTPGNAAVVGVADAVARADHVHGREGWATAVTAGTTFGAASAIGTSSQVARADHSHGTPANPFAPIANVGDLLIGTGAGAVTNLAAGTAGYVLTSNGADVAPSYQQIPSTTGSTMVFEDAAQETAALTVGDTAPIAIASTSSATPTAPVRIHNFTINYSGTPAGSVTITGVTSGRTYLQLEAPAASPGYFPGDLITSEPLQVANSPNGATSSAVGFQDTPATLVTVS